MAILVTVAFLASVATRDIRVTAGIQVIRDLVYQVTLDIQDLAFQVIRAIADSPAILVIQAFLVSLDTVAILEFLASVVTVDTRVRV